MEMLIMTLTHVHEDEYRRLCREEGLEDGLGRGLSKTIIDELKKEIE